jgi:phosphoserine phosphatase
MADMGAREQPSPVSAPACRLAAFDLDGTLVRGETVCDIFARKLGYIERMQALERFHSETDLGAARAEMAAWYRATTLPELCAGLRTARLAPRVREGFALLRAHAVTIALVSITWEFAVAWFAQDLGADHFVGTHLADDGRITHLWARDKAVWLADLARRSGLRLDEVAAVGDSAGDVSMLRIVGRPVFVGTTVPEGLEGVAHYPDGDIYAIAQRIVGASRSTR